jgi:hypothetical protein
MRSINIYFILPVFCFALLIINGCGGSQMGAPKTSSGEYPDWYINAPNDPENIYVTQTATSQDLQLAINKALVNARAELARIVETRMQGVIKYSKEKYGISDQSEDMISIQNVTEKMKQDIVSSAEVKKQSVVRDGNAWRAFVCISTDVNSVEGGLLNYLDYYYSDNQKAQSAPLPTKEPQPVRMPEFPWQPPKPSSMTQIPDEFLQITDKTKLDDIAHKIALALDDAGYEYTYYSAQDGFAIASKIEQYNKDGTSKTGSDRYASEITPPKIFSIESFVKALFCANPGLYRVFAFIVTTVPVVPGTKPISKDSAVVIASSGSSGLASDVAEIKATRKYHCTVLVYEYEQKSVRSDAKEIVPGAMVGKDHLTKAKIFKGL